MTRTRIGALAASVAAALGLIGYGVHAGFATSGQAVANISVGQFSCSVSSTDPSAVITNGGHSLTWALPAIESSAPGNSFVSDLTVTNAGTIPEVVHWTETTGGTLAASQWQPSGYMGYATGVSGDPLSNDLTLAAGQSHTYGPPADGASGIGFMWAALDNSYVGKTATVTYTANCSVVPPAPQSKVQFIGAASVAGNGAGGTSLQLAV
jgi:hypothetical protein